MHKGKITFMWIFLVLAAVLAGCGQPPQEVEQLFESDTVINIPLNPEPIRQETEAGVSENAAAPTQETAAEPTEETAEPTVSETSSGEKSSGRTSKPSATKQPETTPPAAVPPETASPEPVTYDMSGYVPGALEYAVAEQINVCREEAGLEPLAMDMGLSAVASVRAYEIRGYWSHTRPDGSQWQSVLSDNGWGYSTAAEELVHATGFDGAAIVDKWMNAQSAEADLLNPDFTTIGVGAYTENGMVFLAAILIG